MEKNTENNTELNNIELNNNQLNDNNENTELNNNIDNNMEKLNEILKKEEDTYLSNEDILTYVNAMIKMKKSPDMKKLKIIDEKEYKKKILTKFLKLNLNLPSIYNKIMDDDDFEIDRLKEMLSLRREVETNKVTNYDASVKISQKYTDEFVKKPLNIK